MGKTPSSAALLSAGAQGCWFLQRLGAQYSRCPLNQHQEHRLAQHKECDLDQVQVCHRLSGVIPKSDGKKAWKKRDGAEAAAGKYGRDVSAFLGSLYPELQSETCFGEKMLNS